VLQKNVLVMLQKNVLVMLLHPGFSGMAGLPTLSFTTFTGCAIHYGGVKNMKIKIRISNSAEMYTLVTSKLHAKFCKH
jgi:hypothetical protein